MEQKILLDTNACIEIIKNSIEGKNIVEKVGKSEVTISSVSVFELYSRKTNIDKIDLFLKKVTIIPFDELSTKIASDIKKELNRKGYELEFRDIFIAATCIANNVKLVTLNINHFKNIKELELIPLYLSNKES